MSRTSITILGSLGGQNETQINGACCRAGTAVSIVVDGELYLLDCGVGTVARLLAAGLDLGRLRHVFITHHHADHNADLSTLLTLAYTSGAPDITVHGPEPTARFVTTLRDLQRQTIGAAEQLGARRRFTATTRSAEFPLTGPVTAEGQTVLDDGRVQVTAKVVDHGGVPSVAYRFRTPDRDVTFSGDTGGRTSLADFARGSDTLVHEVIDYPTVYAALVATQGGASQQFLDHLQQDHSSPEVCGRAATDAGVPTLVLYHLIPAATGYPDALWRSHVAPYYQGNVVVAKDLLAI